MKYALGWYRRKQKHIQLNMHAMVDGRRLNTCAELESSILAQCEVRKSADRAFPFALTVLRKDSVADCRVSIDCDCATTN